MKQFHDRASVRGTFPLAGAEGAAGNGVRVAADGISCCGYHESEFYLMRRTLSQPTFVLPNQGSTGIRLMVACRGETARQWHHVHGAIPRRFLTCAHSLVPWIAPPGLLADYQMPVPWLRQGVAGLRTITPNTKRI